MAASGFKIEAFEADIALVLTDCKYINLPFELPSVCDEVNYLLTKCGSTFFRDDFSEDSKLHLKECLLNAELVIQLAWEKINTGYWKNVDKNWRYAYTLASLFKVLCLLQDKETSKFDIIKACDMGLLMGAPLMKNILSRIAFKISSSIQEDKWPIFAGSKFKNKKLKTDSNAGNYRDLVNEIPEKKDVSYGDFMECYLKQNKPVVLLDVINEWPALSTWNIDYILNKAGCRTVPIEIGSKYTDDNWTQKLMTMEDFITNYIQHNIPYKGVGYLAQYNLFDQIPELLADIDIPWYISQTRDRSDVDISVYFGPDRTVSPLHHDPKQNLLVQVMGEKYIRLYSKEMTQYLYPREGTWLSNTSQVDVDDPDLVAFPLYAKAIFQECILKPGNTLYIPPGCWHYVRSLTVSLSISFWWE